MKSLRSFLGILVPAVLCVSSALAQTVTGTITGEVRDPSSALVTGATVTAINAATSVKTTVKTNADGLYTIRFLPIGTYNLTIEAPGFTTENIGPFPLEIDQTAKVNGSLKIGTSSTVVVTETFHPILDTDDATLGNTLSTTEIENIPLNGRNFSSLTLYQPGAVDTDPTGMGGNNAIERNTYNSGIASINGNREQENNYTLEGADNNEPQNNLIAYNPSPDAIAEVRVISANANATYGNANGGAIVTILKSGTNHFHGSAFDFLENQNLDANSWGNGLTDSPITKYTQNIFGATFGGPVVRDKLFFFLDYEGVRRHSAQPEQAASLLTPQMLQGDFSALLNPSLPNGTVQLYDTQNNFTPFQNDQVPVNNPVAQFLAAHPNIYPAPNATPTDGLIQNDYVGPQQSFVTNNQEDFKVDWTPTSTDKLNGFYSQGTGSDFTTAIIPVSFPAHNSYPTKIAGASLVHTFSPTIVNEFRFGFTRVRWNNGVPTDPSGLFGIRGDAVVGIPFSDQTYAGFSSQSLGNNASSIGTNASPQVFTDNTFNYTDSLTWQRGRHLWTIGGQAIRYQQNYLNAGNVGFLGTFGYSGQFTALPNGAGYGPADFVLDRVENIQLASPTGNVGNRQWRLAGFFQDDFKVSSRLTLNLGIRYEFDQPWYEQNNKTANVLPGGTVEYAGHVPAGAVPGSVVCPTRACYKATYDQFMPRFGFAYQPTSKMVVRGGFGASSFFEGYSFNQRLTSSPPFSLAINSNAIVPTTGSGGSPFAVTDGFGGQQFGINPNYNLYSVWPQNTQPAYIYQYNLTSEYAVTSELSLSVGYHGQNGFHLADYRNGNQLTLAQAPAVATGGCNASYPAVDQPPYYALVGECGTILVTESEARMNYNSGQLTLRQRTHHGLEYTLNYTVAKSLTDSSGNYAVGALPFASFNGSTFQNAYDMRADWGPSALDVRQSLNFVGVYDLPFGHGRTYGGNINGALNAVFGGWRFATSAILYSGFPVSIFSPGESNTFNTFGFNRANQYSKITVRDRSIFHWWGTDQSADNATNCPSDGACAYGVPQNFTFGSASNSTERAPGYRQVDTSLFKDFHLWREQTLGFRADFFNIFNIASYGYPDNGITDTSFGLISSVRSPPRQIQLSLHYSF
jgi:Carboxypeptidase regulatory-like domain/TonB dependent receptor